MAGEQEKKGESRPQPSRKGTRDPVSTDRAAERPEFVRRALALGLSGVFMTQETLRKALGDALPKEWVDFAVDQSDRTRKEFIDRFVEEIVRVLDSTDLAELLDRLLAGRVIEVNARVQLHPRDGRDSVRFSVVGGRKRK